MISEPEGKLYLLNNASLQLGHQLNYNKVSKGQLTPARTPASLLPRSSQKSVSPSPREKPDPGILQLAHKCEVWQDFKTHLREWSAVRVTRRALSEVRRPAEQRPPDSQSASHQLASRWLRLARSTPLTTRLWLRCCRIAGEGYRPRALFPGIVRQTTLAPPHVVCSQFRTSRRTD